MASRKCNCGLFTFIHDYGNGCPKEGPVQPRVADLVQAPPNDWPQGSPETFENGPLGASPSHPFVDTHFQQAPVEMPVGPDRVMRVACFCGNADLTSPHAFEPEGTCPSEPIIRPVPGSAPSAVPLCDCRLNGHTQPHPMTTVCGEAYDAERAELKATVEHLRELAKQEAEKANVVQQVTEFAALSEQVEALNYARRKVAIDDVLRMVHGNEQWGSVEVCEFAQFLLTGDVPKYVTDNS